MSTPNTGITKAVATFIDAMRPGEKVSVTDTLRRHVHETVPAASDKSIGYTLSYCMGKGMLSQGEVRGIYIKPKPVNGHAVEEPKVDVEQVVIDNLLDAMAKAEPVLKRMKKLLAALDAVK